MSVCDDVIHKKLINPNKASDTVRARMDQMRHPAYERSERHKPTSDHTKLQMPMKNVLTISVTATLGSC
jgi:hypothetical protein